MKFKTLPFLAYVFNFEWAQRKIGCRLATVGMGEEEVMAYIQRKSCVAARCIVGLGLLTMGCSVAVRCVVDAHTLAGQLSLVGLVLICWPLKMRTGHSLKVLTRSLS